MEKSYAESARSLSGATSLPLPQAPSLRVPPPPATSVDSLPAPSVNPSPAPSVEPLTLMEVQTGIELFSKQFRSSDRFKSLKPFFEQGRKANITQCLCLGLGHFISLEQKPMEQREFNGNFNRSLHQLAMLELLLKGLAKGSEIRVYFQDTTFSESERNYLQSCDYTVLQDDPDLKTMSASTFLFVPFLTDVSVSRALMAKFPALYVGIDLRIAIEDIRMHENKKIRDEKEKYIRPVELFKRASFRNQGLPILALGLIDGFETWKDASVHWLKPRYERAKVADGPVKGAGRSKTTDQRTLPSSAIDKGKKKDPKIDAWAYDFPEEGKSTTPSSIKETGKDGGLDGETNNYSTRISSTRQKAKGKEVVRENWDDDSAKE